MSGNSIPHVTNCSIREIIEHVLPALKGEVPANYTEKVDGVNGAFGCDEHGVFVSRELKNGDRFYSIDEIRKKAKGPKWMLEILFTHVNYLCSIIKIPSQGFFAECEMLYGPRPNVLDYNSPGTIVILNTDSDHIIGRFESLHSVYNPLRHLINCNLYGPNGVNNVTIPVYLKVKRLHRDSLSKLISPVSRQELYLTIRSIEHAIEMFKERWDMDIAAASEIKLNRVPVSDRPGLLRIREDATETTRDITDRLLKSLLSINIIPDKSKFAEHTPQSSLYRQDRMKNSTIEGIVVVVENSSKFRFKIVDKERFSQINRAYHYINNQLINTFIPRPFPGSFDTLPSIWKLVKQGEFKETGCVYSHLLHDLSSQGAVTLENKKVLTHKVAKNLKQQDISSMDMITFHTVVNNYKELLDNIKSDLIQLFDLDPFSIYSFLTLQNGKCVSYDKWDRSKVWESFHRLQSYLNNLNHVEGTADFCKVVNNP